MLGLGIGGAIALVQASRVPTLAETDECLGGQDCDLAIDGGDLDLPQVQPFIEVDPATDPTAGHDHRAFLTLMDMLQARD